MQEIPTFLHIPTYWRQFRSAGPPVLRPERTVVLCVPLELSYRRQHASPVVTMAHGPGDPYARVGSVARRVSSADGRRLRSRRRALSFFTGATSHGRSAYFPWLDLPFP